MMTEVKKFQANQANAVKSIKAMAKTIQKERVLNFKMVMSSPEQAQWEKANYEDFQRFKDIFTLHYVRKADIPRNRKIACYNPQIKVKTINGVTAYRVRGTIGSDKVHYQG